jgi:hypothetical protein
MAKIKMKGKHQRQAADVKPGTNQSPFMLSKRYQDTIYILLLLILLILLLKPLVLDRLSPQGVDVIGTKGQTHQIIQYREETGKTALWNPYMFAGMPVYPRIVPVLYSIDNMLLLFGKCTNLIFIYYLFAAIGFYLLIRYLKMPPLIAFFAAISFLLLPHYKSLYIEGHFAKFRAVMFLPWIFLSFKYFLDKRSIISAALFALSFGLQIRTQHYQIVFYTALLLFTLGLQPLLKNIFEKKYKLFIQSTLLIFLSITLAILLAAQPLFSAKEYIPYSKRGKTTIDLKKPESSQETSRSAGVTFEYATQWSTHPSELLTWIIPHFYGGMSGEIYTGDSYPQLRNKQIPGYWGHMPFTQSYEYMGIITIILALFAIYIWRKNKMILSLVIFTAFLILLSFGRHFQLLYKLFFDYFPYFNKFRAPMMSVTMSSFLICIFAAYGLHYLYNIKATQSLKEHKNILIILGGVIVLGFIIYISSQSFGFIKTGENYDNSTMTVLKNMRSELLIQDIKRYLILTIVITMIILLFLRNKISALLLGLCLIVLNIFDLWNIQAQHQAKFIDVQKMERRYFARTSTDQFLLNDPNIFRIYPAGNIFSDNRWSYYHQSIGGYSAIKMYTIEELIENNLNHSLDNVLPINWNVLQFLNVKYIIIRQEVMHPKLVPVNTDKANSLYTYFFKDYLPRGYFVGSYQVIPDEYQRLHAINDTTIKFHSTAILEEKPANLINTPDSCYSEVTQFSPNYIAFDLFTDKTSLFVISELFYPPGWKIFLDGQKVEKIYKTNHAIQSIIVPEGKHTIELQFAPDSYHNNVRKANFSLLIIYLSIIVSLLIHNREKLVNVIKKMNKK